MLDYAMLTANTSTTILFPDDFAYILLVILHSILAAFHRVAGAFNPTTA